MVDCNGFNFTCFLVVILNSERWETVTVVLLVGGISLFMIYVFAMATEFEELDLKVQTIRCIDKGLCYCESCTTFSPPSKFIYCLNTTKKYESDVCYCTTTIKEVLNK